MLPGIKKQLHISFVEQYSFATAAAPMVQQLFGKKMDFLPKRPLSLTRDCTRSIYRFISLSTWCELFACLQVIFRHCSRGIRCSNILALLPIGVRKVATKLGDVIVWTWVTHTIGYHHCRSQTPPRGLTYLLHSPWRQRNNWNWRKKYTKIYVIID